MNELQIYSSADNIPLSIAWKEPSQDKKAIIQISHGMAEHKERYYMMMDYLVNHGYVVVINDHRGHGKSIVDENDLGFFYENKGNYIVDDLYQVNCFIRDKYPDLPVILLGHSMGSLVVRKYIQKYENSIQGLVICGSPSQNSMVQVGLLLAKIIKHIKGDHFRCPFLQKLTVGAYSKNIEDYYSKNAWLSINAENVKAYDLDPLCGFNFTTNGYINLFHLMIDTYQTKLYHPVNPSLPIYFIAGSNDPVIVSEKKWNQAIDFLKQVGYTNISSKLYTGFRHEIFNEQIKESIYDDLIQFIETNRCSKK